MGVLADIRATFAIAWTDVRLLLRDRAAAFFTFVFPIIFAMFFGFMFGGGGGERGKIEIAVVQLDQGPAATAFIEDLKKTGEISVKMVPTAEEAEAMVRKGEVIASIVLPSTFQKDFDNLLSTGKGPKLEGFVDPSRKAEAGLLEGRLNELAFRTMGKSFSDPAKMKQNLAKVKESIAKASDIDNSRKILLGAALQNMDSILDDNQKQAAAGKSDALSDPMANFRPVQVDLKELTRKRVGPTNSFEVSLPQGIVWGLMGCVTAFVSTLAHDRQRGTLVRLLSAPVSRWQVVGGKALAGFISCMLVQWVLIGLFAAVFNVKLTNPPMLLIATLASAFAFVGVMMFLSVIGRSGEGSAGFGRSVILVMAMIGGGTIPIFFMPKFMQTVSSASPFKWAVLAIEGALWRGFTPAEMMYPLLVLCGIGVVGFVLGVMMFRRAMKT
ncbi:MAG: ABC transporter permease [Phycisphaeraceae bacterium]|nr:ABC transporter permease [Phycisphaeraceae bacterium]